MKKAKVVKKVDPRWDRDCSYCWVYLRKHYTYDHAMTHGFCPRCKTHKPKEKTVDDGIKPERCPKAVKRPAPRVQSKKLGRLIVPGESSPATLRNAKWSSLKKWAEKTRDHFEKKGLFCTIGALMNLVYRTDMNYDRRAKAANRLKDLYRTEWDEWKQGVEKQIEDAVRREKVAEEKRKQLLQEKNTALPEQLSVKEQAVLNCIGREPVSKKEIRTASKLKKVSGLLKKLLKRKLIVREGTEYRLARKKEMEKPRAGKRPSRR